VAAAALADVGISALENAGSGETPADNEGSVA